MIASTSPALSNPIGSRLVPCFASIEAYDTRIREILGPSGKIHRCPFGYIQANPMQLSQRLQTNHFLIRNVSDLASYVLAFIKALFSCTLCGEFPSLFEKLTYRKYVSSYEMDYSPNDLAIKISHLWYEMIGESLDLRSICDTFIEKADKIREPLKLTIRISHQYTESNIHGPFYVQAFLNVKATSRDSSLPIATQCMYDSIFPFNYETNPLLYIFPHIRGRVVNTD